ncbi:tRNA/rRNA methyltransferase [Sphingomonas sp. PvP055]
MLSPPPVLVLVRPQLGENIGKAARAMLNFGLTEMRLVSPRDGWPNPSAGPAASGADIVLEQAKVFETVADAIADCAHVYATTVRKRGVTKPVVTPEAAAQAIHATAGRSAILFGPERSGLETDDVAVARSIITVPINPEFGSLNLAQAVILVAYEWSKGVALASPPEVDMPLPAPQEELDGMIAQLEAMLEESDFFFPPARTPVTRRTLRTLLTKPGWSTQGSADDAGGAQFARRKKAADVSEGRRPGLVPAKRLLLSALAPLREYLFSDVREERV